MLTIKDTYKGDISYNFAALLEYEEVKTPKEFWAESKEILFNAAKYSSDRKRKKRWSMKENINTKFKNPTNREES